MTTAPIFQHPQIRPRRYSRPLVALWVIAPFLSALPALASAAGLTAETVVGSVRVQRPGTDGNPGGLQLLLDRLINKGTVVADGAALHDTDGLRGKNAESAVQLVCSNGATLTLSGEFDAYLRLGAGDEGCTVYLRAGTAVATTGTSEGSQIPTVIQYGDVTLGARSTQFGATITSSPGATTVQADAYVIEGVVDVKQAPATGAPSQLTLLTGQQLVANTTQAAAISEARFSTLATTYAKLSAKAAPEPQRAAVQQELQGAYTESLRHPNDAVAQRALIKVYETRQLQVSPAAKYRTYQIDRVNPAALAVPQNLSPAQ